MTIDAGFDSHKSELLIWPWPNLYFEWLILQSDKADRHLCSQPNRVLNSYAMWRRNRSEHMARKGVHHLPRSTCVMRMGDRPDQHAFPRGKGQSARLRPGEYSGIRSLPNLRERTTDVLDFMSRICFPFESEPRWDRYLFRQFLIAKVYIGMRQSIKRAQDNSLMIRWQLRCCRTV